jgi:hypothetical protein
MRALSFRVVLGLLLLFAVAACGGPKSQIVGKWKVDREGADMVWEFAKNGAVTGAAGAGKYSFGDRNRLKIQTQFATFVYEIQLSGDTMTWRDPNGAVTRLKRLP